ncbi:hypothetical protein [Cytobacillus sp.]|uniref:hypothetical protein n=1 Tax=Cytobacillus sp. TaxID=2675269 RepID=UPI0028BD62A5|nr:hypothetical protein [Cytobacillus sp.]
MKKIISKGLLDEELDKCKDQNGQMVRIPILSSIRVVDGEVYCEVQGYEKVTDNLLIDEELTLH